MKKMAARGRWAMKRQGVDPIVFLDFDAEQKQLLPIFW